MADEEIIEEPKKKVEAGGAGMGWIVTFSDCMTLLLCFFVLLMTFSSFDEVEFETMAGSFDSLNQDWVLENNAPQPELIIEDVTNDPLKEGSLLPTDQEWHKDPPRMPLEVISRDMYKDRTALCFPSEKFFNNNGLVLSDEGKKYLNILALYLQKAANKIVIGAEGLDDRVGLRQRRRKQVSEMIDFLVEENGISASRFCVSSGWEIPDEVDWLNVVKIEILNFRIDG